MRALVRVVWDRWIREGFRRWGTWNSRLNIPGRSRGMFSYEISFRVDRPSAHGWDTFY